MGFFDFLFSEDKSHNDLMEEARDRHMKEEYKNIPILERRIDRLTSKSVEIEKKIDTIALKEAQKIIKNGEINTYQLKIHPNVKRLINEYEKIKSSDYRWNDRKKKLWLEMLENHNILSEYEINTESHYYKSFLVQLMNNAKKTKKIEPKLKDWELIYVLKISDQANAIIYEFQVKEQEDKLAEIEFKRIYFDSRKKIEKSVVKIDKSELCLIRTPLPNSTIRETADKRWGESKKDEWQRLKAQNTLYGKWDKERNKLIKNRLLEEEKKDLFINKPADPVPRTGDDIRFNDFNREANKDNHTNRYLYLVKIKSRIDDKNYIKIGLTSKDNIDDRFDLDDVVDLIEIYRLIKLDSKTAMALEYNLIRKYRPKGYIAEKEFDQFSRFSGYTEIIPMRRITDACQDIDNVVDNFNLEAIEPEKNQVIDGTGFDDNIPF
jgi:hypothetical protein